MLLIHCAKHLFETLNFAADADCLNLLLDRLFYLDQYGGNNARCELHFDFAPHSFGFAIVCANGTTGMVGGLIYGGPGESTSGGPAYSVEITPDMSSHRWMVHT